MRWLPECAPMRNRIPRVRSVRSIRDAAVFPVAAGAPRSIESVLPGVPSGAQNSLMTGDSMTTPQAPEMSATERARQVLKMTPRVREYFEQLEAWATRGPSYGRAQYAAALTAVSERWQRSGGTLTVEQLTAVAQDATERFRLERERTAERSREQESLREMHYRPRPATARNAS